MFIHALHLFQNGRVFFQRQATAPSIPIPGLNCGYEQTASGQLNPQKLPDRDNTIGPAYYNLFHVSLDEYITYLS